MKTATLPCPNCGHRMRGYRDECPKCHVKSTLPQRVDAAQETIGSRVNRRVAMLWASAATLGAATVALVLLGFCWPATSTAALAGGCAAIGMVGRQIRRDLVT